MAPSFLPVSRPLTLAEAAGFRNSLDAAGRKLVFTSGCFDLLHAGHVRYLAQARALGDALIIALNSDASVRELKGPSRPVNSQDDRAEVLLALSAVDAVVVFDDERTIRLIEAIRPHIFAKGGDYTEETLHQGERQAVLDGGGRIAILPELKGRSTTATLARMAAPGTARPRLAVIGSGNGSNFEAVAQAIEDGSLCAEIALVLSDNPDAFLLERARRRGLPATFLDPGPAANRFADEAQQALTEKLKAARIDLLVCAGFMRRLKAPVLTEFAGRIVNIHPSLLPAFPGREAWVQALAAGVRETGCTVHLVDEGLDTGPTLAQATVPVHPADTADTLRDRINAAEQRLYPLAIASFLTQLR